LVLTSPSSPLPRRRRGDIGPSGTSDRTNPFPYADNGSGRPPASANACAVAPDACAVAPDAHAFALNERAFASDERSFESNGRCSGPARPSSGPGERPSSYRLGWPLPIIGTRRPDRGRGRGGHQGGTRPPRPPRRVGHGLLGGLGALISLGVHLPLSGFVFLARALAYVWGWGG
jgi:hypothetical protein